MIKAVIDNLISEKPRHNFTVGINDDVSFTSLKVGEEFDTVLNSIAKNFIIIIIIPNTYYYIDQLIYFTCIDMQYVLVLFLNFH